MSRDGWSGRVVTSARAQVLRPGVVCWLCGGGYPTVVDHVVPRREGGTNELGNLRPAHSYCNNMRGRERITSSRR